MHTLRQQPARKEQQLATDVHIDAGGSVHNTVPRRSDDNRTHSSLNRTTTVRTTRACRRTSLCNLRAHSFVQLPQHLTGTSQLSMYKNCVILAAHNASQKRARMSQLLRRFIGKTCMNG